MNSRQFKPKNHMTVFNNFHVRRFKQLREKTIYHKIYLCLIRLKQTTIPSHSRSLCCYQSVPALWSLHSTGVVTMLTCMTQSTAAVKCLCWLISQSVLHRNPVPVTYTARSINSEGTFKNRICLNRWVLFFSSSLFILSLTRCFCFYF